MNPKIVTAAVAASALVALSACGSSTAAKPAATTTAAATSGSHGMSSMMAARGGVVDGQMVATMMADAMVAKKTAHMMLSTNGKPVGEGDYEFSNPINVSMKMSQQGVNLEIVQVRGVLYIKGIPGLPKPWLKVDPKGSDPFSRAMSSLGDLSKGNDPRAVVSMMKGVKGRDLGTAQVDGVSTRHFSFEVRLSAFGKLLSPQMLKAVRTAVKGPIATDYWVGDDSLPRKVTSEVPLSGKKQSTEILYSDWGKPVHIAAPPAAAISRVPGSRSGA